jgi:Fe-S cluster assembly iron-binding protein IscA
VGDCTSDRREASVLEITEEAADVLERAYDAAARFNPDARVRLYASGDQVQTAFADAPEPEDSVIEHGGLTIFVERGISGTLDVSDQHDHLVVR